MKPYKPFLLVLMIFALIVSLSGCIIIPLSKHYNISAEEVDSVQFYDLRVQESAISPPFYITSEATYTVPAENKKDFLNDFSKLKFSDTIIIALAAIDPSFSYGEWVVRINFTNGQYTFYSCAGYGETFDAEGNCISSSHFGCDKGELETLISKYYKIES